VAPLRHAELRRAREQRAVNFQREAATITFSGPQVAYALPPGAQDRLSWMIQLPAILEADAALTRAGAVVTLFVAGTRGVSPLARVLCPGAIGRSRPGSCRHR